MRFVWIALLPICVLAQDYGLKNLITHAHQSNPMIKVECTSQIQRDGSCSKCILANA